ncbi:MAG: SMI1/KNR4 family protein [Polyangiaceae bacterium]|nr:SMI1/KNR4 family protein [Polyangiaceae bacterium]
MPESALKTPLPSEYKDFLLFADGGEGFVGSAYLVLWSIADLIHLNEEYGVREYAPGLLVFGSDGGGEAFAFDMRSHPNRIVMIPFVGMALSEIIFVADDFTSFLERLSGDDRERLVRN